MLFAFHFGKSLYCACPVGVVRVRDLAARKHQLSKCLSCAMKFHGTSEFRGLAEMPRCRGILETLQSSAAKASKLT